MKKLAVIAVVVVLALVAVAALAYKLGWLGAPVSGGPASSTSARPAASPAGSPEPAPIDRTAPLDLAAPVAALTPEERQKAYDAEVADLRQRVARLEAYVDAFPKALTDVDALAGTLPTPQAAFAFVRDQVALEPYAGVMKGARGTLITRGGNALDRALLLAAVLKRHDVSARIAHGRLAPAQAQALVDQVTASPAAAERMLATLAGRPARPASTEEQRALADGVRRRADSVGAAIRRAIDNVRPALESSLAAAGLPRAAEAPGRPIDAASDHYWVQATIDGQAVDFDPTMAGAAQGARLAEATDTLDPDDLPAQLFQRLTFRVVADRLVGSRVTSAEVLSEEFAAPDLVGENIRLGLAPESLKTARTTCRAILLAGDRRKESAGIALDRLGRLVVEVASTGPGLPEARYRRVVMDRLEAVGDGYRIQPALTDDAVRALLVQAWDGTVSVGASHVAFTLRALLDTVKAQETVEAKARAQVYLGVGFGVSDLPEPTLSKELVGFFLSSDISRSLLGLQGGRASRSYNERPRVAFMRHGFVVGDWSRPEGEHRFADGIDLLNAPFRFTGREADAARTALEASIADTALERALAGPAPFNTLPVFAAAAGQGVATTTIRADQAAALDAVAVPPAIRDVLARELARGQVLVLPNRLVALNGVQTFGWWSIDPSTGTALGQMELGGGQGFVEVTKMHERVEKWTEMFAKFYGGVMRCYLEALGDNLGGIEPLKTGHLKQGKPGETPMPEPGKLAECVIAQACDLIAELLVEASITPAFAKEAEAAIKPLQEIIAEWLMDQAVEKMKGDVQKAVGKACEQRMGVGGAN